MNIDKLEKEFKLLSKIHKCNPTSSLSAKLDTVRLALNLAPTSATVKSLRWLGARFYTQKDKIRGVVWSLRFPNPTRDSPPFLSHPSLLLPPPEPYPLPSSLTSLSPLERTYTPTPPPPNMANREPKTSNLNTPEKLSQLLSNMWSMKADIIFLQETHFCSKKIPNLANRFYPHSYHSTSPFSKSKQVSVLLSKKAPIQISDSLIENQGRFVFLKGTFRNKTITLANIYSSNWLQVPFFRAFT